MNSIDKLIKIFSEFPGIGPKQARRFVYFLISRNQSYIDELVQEISELRAGVATCADCKRYFLARHDDQNLCSVCSDKTRDTSILMIVSRDIDLENVEKSHTFT